ncbi:MAG: hypothetical protein ACM3SW_14165 [Actinomycetota bacterium]
MDISGPGSTIIRATSTGTTRIPVVALSQDPLGTYDVTFPFWIKTEMEPLGAQLASTADEIPVIRVTAVADRGP